MILGIRDQEDLRDDLTEGGRVMAHGPWDTDPGSIHLPLAWTSAHPGERRETLLKNRGTRPPAPLSL